MTVKELIAALNNMPPGKQVMICYDGALRLPPDAVWLARSGVVGIGQSGEMIYDTADRPKHSPTSKRDPYWRIADQKETPDLSGRG